MSRDRLMRCEHVFKLLVTGPFAAGKTTLIQAVSQTPVVDTDVATSGGEAGVKARTTVAMDFGTHTVGGTDAHSPDDEIRLLMYGTPGQRRFWFMTDVLKSSVDAVVYVVDAESDDSHAEAGDEMRSLLRDLHVPLVVAVNRCDDHRRADLVARSLGALASDAVVPCQLIRPDSAHQVVVAALSSVLDRLESSTAPVLDPIERTIALALAA